MAILQMGSGLGEASVAVTGTGAPTAVDKFLGGAKVWLNPGYITTEMAALWAGLKADAVGTLTNPRALGFLLVPAAAIAVVWGMAAAKRRRQRNPGRVRWRNPRRWVTRGRRRNPELTYYLLTAVDGHDRTIGSDSLMTDRVTEAVHRARQLANKCKADGNNDVRVRIYKEGGTKASFLIHPNPRHRPRKTRKHKAAGKVLGYAIPRRRRNPKYEIYNHKTGVTAGRTFDNKSDAARWVAMRKAETSLKQYWKVRPIGGGRRKNGRSYIRRGVSMPQGYTPGPGKIFYLSGRKGVVKSVSDGANGSKRWVTFRRSVDGTTGMSLANFRQAAYIE